MSQLENLESTLLASRKITDFLKMFSDTQWPRMLKATMILGIQHLQLHHCPDGINKLFPKQIEDIVVLNEESIMRTQQKKIAEAKPKVAPPPQVPTVALRSNNGSKKQGQSQPKQAQVSSRVSTSRATTVAKGSAPQFKNSFKKGAITTSNPNMLRSSSVPKQIGENRLAKKAERGIVPYRTQVQSARGSAELRQSHSESVIYDRKQKVNADLDPRIYPAWWGEPYQASKARKKAPPQLPEETSLERGMREIRETAANLDANLGRLRAQRGTAEPPIQGPGEEYEANVIATEREVRVSDANAGFGSSFRPHPSQAPRLDPYAF